MTANETAPAPASTTTPAKADPPPLGVGGFLRWMWTQLTSMRTALVLLFALAVASIPGSILPQWGNDPIKTREWVEANPTLGPVLDRLGFFDVYASTWFAAIYLLLFVSLIGCVLPRIGQLWRSLRAPLPRAPRNLARLESYEQLDVDATPDDVLDRAQRALRQARWRTRRGSSPVADGGDGSQWVAAEKGYLREAGNLTFHLALVGVLAGVAFGGLNGWRGDVIVRVGEGFSNTLTQYDAWGGGRFADVNALPPFSFRLKDFDVEFERGDVERGSPRLFQAGVVVQDSPDAPERAVTVGVNEPLVIDAAKAFLVGHGYAPHVIVRDGDGRVVLDDSVVFLPQDGNFTSTGVVKVPDARPQSLAFDGFFLPTVGVDANGIATSTFPAPDDPALVLTAWTGDLGLDDGVPQSIYSLDTDGLTELGTHGLRPGETWDLPDGSGSIEFAGYVRWASFRIAHDPGKELVLLAAVLATLGLMASLFIRRRRVWVKVWAADAAATGAASTVQVAGLRRSATTDDSAEEHELAPDIALLRAAVTGSTDTGSTDASSTGTDREDAQ